jgi:hypothetical protein
MVLSDGDSLRLPEDVCRLHTPRFGPSGSGRFIASGFVWPCQIKMLRSSLNIREMGRLSLYVSGRDPIFLFHAKSPLPTRSLLSSFHLYYFSNIIIDSRNSTVI